METNEKIIQQTRTWINQVVIGCNFCPFAAKEMKNDTIHYSVVNSESTEDCLTAFMEECKRLDNSPEIETTLLIYPLAFADFEEYLDLVDMAEQLILDQDYEGIYQVASFHPHYLFAGSTEKDASNYTNRSPYPMLHLLREASIEKVLEKYPDPESIPERNIRFAEEKGVEWMRALLQTSREIKNGE